MLTVSHPLYSIRLRFRIGAISSWATVGACLIGRILLTNIFSPQSVENWLACKGVGSGRVGVARQRVVVERGAAE